MHPGDIVRMPQPQMAQHGFDGLIVHAAVSSVTGVSICEQKATDDPRGKVTSEVWPEFDAFERAERDDILVAEVTSLLAAVAPTNATHLVSAIAWERSRWYRAAVTARERDGGPTGLLHLFAGYDSHVSGSITRRRGEALHLDALRPWMDRFAAAVEAHLRSACA